MDRSLFWIVILLCIALLISIFVELAQPAFADYVGTIYPPEGEPYSIYLEVVPTPTPAPTPEPTIEPSPSPSPEPTPYVPNDYEIELVTQLGHIEAFLIFFTVILLCFFAYRFLRLFI